MPNSIPLSRTYHSIDPYDTILIRTCSIGKGGFGTVKRAFCRRTRQPYAVKILDPGLPGFETDHVRIRREIEIMQKTKHVCPLIPFHD